MDYEYYSVDPYYPLDPQREVDTVRDVLCLYDEECQRAEEAIKRFFTPRFNIGPLGARFFGRELMVKCERPEDIKTTLLR